MNLIYIGIGFFVAAVYLFLKSRQKDTRESYMSHDAHDDEDVETLAQSGRIVSAIKAYRKLHNVGLSQAKLAVEAMLDKNHHNSSHIDDDLNLNQNEKILRLAKSGHKIAAVKSYRETYRVGLKEAKDAVEAMLRNNKN
ncbi:MAG: hypothetical protein AB8B80_08040 [Marinicellaceae bacterium]